MNMQSYRTAGGRLNGGGNIAEVPRVSYMVYVEDIAGKKDEVQNWHITLIL